MTSSDEQRERDLLAPVDVEDPGFRSVVLDLSALAVIIALSVVLALGTTGPGRVLLSLTFLLFVPGRAVVSLLPFARRSPSLALCVVSGISILVIASVVALFLHLWQPEALYGVEAGLSFVAILLSIGRATSRPSAIAHRFSLDQGRRPRLHLADAAIPLALGLWAWSITRVRVADLGGLGLIGALPVTYFVAVGVVVVSASGWVTRARLSAARLMVHVIALAVILYGTAPLIYTEPRYAWLYKHIGVVQYITVHGHLGISNDIYQDWPGFFALAAWFDRIAGLSSPLSVAAWAQLLFNLLDCLVLGFATRGLHMTPRERWLAVMMFLSANWVAQDYFSPQATGFVLSLGILALALNYFRSASLPSRLESLAVRLGRLRLLHATIKPAGPEAHVLRSRRAGPGWSWSSGGSALWMSRAYWAGLVVLVSMFVALVSVHELSPYVIVMELAVLTVVGRFRPTWLTPVLLLIAVLYFAPHFTYVNRTFGLLASIGNFFSNARPPSALGLHLSGDQQLVADAARLLSVLVWALALLGIWRRLRVGRPVLVLAVLAFSPFLLLGLQAYGGEALLRIQLFSLPWSACLAASALSPQQIDSRDGWWSIVVGSQRASRLVTPVALVVSVTLFLPSYFGSDQLNTMSPEDVAASVYLDAHAQPGTVIYLDQDFPISIGARYYLLLTQALLGANEAPGGFSLSSSAVATVTFSARQYSHSGGSVYFVVTDTMLRYALAYGLTTSTSLAPLELAMDQSPYWHTVYRRGETVIYEFART